MTAQNTDDQDTQHAQDIALHRGALEFSVAAALLSIAEAAAHRAVLAGDQVCDVEHAEGQDSQIVDQFLHRAHFTLRAAQVMVEAIHRDDPQ